MAEPSFQSQACKRIPPVEVGWLFGFLLVARVLAANAASLGETIVFTGMGDASAAVAVSGDRFLAASDEDNTLRLYRLSQPGQPVQTCNLNRLWSARKKAPEMDLEGAARIGQRVFWISSHGRNADGDHAPRRHALFALDLTEAGDTVTLRPVGQIYTNLIAAVSRDPRFTGFRLAEAAERLPEAIGGLSIEALTDTPEGGLLIGFRNPIPAGRALIVPLLNPSEVVVGRPPRFGDPIQLDLGGLGLRGMGFAGGDYYVIGGPARGGREARLFSWKGGSDTPQPVAGVSLTGLNPESICFPEVAGRQTALVLSDDGNRKVNSQDGKSLPESEQQFRAVLIHRPPGSTSPRP